MSEVTIKEQEFCTRCESNTLHSVIYTIMANGNPIRKGECQSCGIKRALPQNNVSDEETELHFGKYKGEKLKDVPSDYLHWLKSKASHGLAKKIERVLYDRYFVRGQGL